MVNDNKRKRDESDVIKIYFNIYLILIIIYINK